MACQAAHGELTVRVDSASGAPRIVVNGKPVRGRMFWGAPGGKPLPADATGRNVTFDFRPAFDEPGQGTIHFRFGAQPGTIWLDDVRITDLDADEQAILPCDFEGGRPAFERHWTCWPTNKANTTATLDVRAGQGNNGTSALVITLRKPADGVWPDFHVYHKPTIALNKAHRYRVSFWVRSDTPRKLQVALYRPGSPFTFLGGPSGVFESQVKLAGDVGVNFVSMPVPMPWPRPGEKPNWDGAEAACRRVLEVNPRALLLPRIGMEAPVWWLDAHPDETMAWDRGAHKRRCAVPASQLYRREAAAHLAALVAHLETTFGDSIAGYHPCGQNTGEWFYEDTWGVGLNGCAPADQRTWREWLKVQRPGTDWSNATVPMPDERRAAPNGVLHDPAAQQRLIDFACYQQEMMAECVCDLAKAVRQASRGKKLVVFFYGYGFEFGAVRNGPATSGHYALRRVLNSPDIDVLCSPISYFDRALAESGPAMSAAESVALAGKLWLCEDDTSTHLSTGTPPGHKERVTNLAETNALLSRNVAQEALRNQASWWMDLTATGWFDDAGMWAQMKRLAAVDDALLARPLPFRPEVAVVLDELAMQQVACGGTSVTRPGVYEVRRPLGRMGAPYGQYLQDDVLRGAVAARMYVLLTPWRLTAAERTKLQQATGPALRVWCYAPGYSDGKRVALDTMRDVCGFQLKPVAPDKAWAEPTDAGRKRGLTQGFGSKEKVKPLFAAADATPDETLATYPDGSAAVALRKAGGGWSLFVGPPGLTSELLRAAARTAGVHLYTERDCNVCANGPYVALHAADDGPLDVAFPGAGQVRDLLSGEKLGSGPKVRVPLSTGQTRILAIGQ